MRYRSGFGLDGLGVPPPDYWSVPYPAPPGWMWEMIGAGIDAELRLMPDPYYASESAYIPPQAPELIGPSGQAAPTPAPAPQGTAIAAPNVNTAPQPLTGTPAATLAPDSGSVEIDVSSPGGATIYAAPPSEAPRSPSMLPLILAGVSLLALG